MSNSKADASGIFRTKQMLRPAELVLGGFTDMQDTERPSGQTIEEIISDKVKEYDYPVCFNFPCGHQEVNYTLRLGMKYKLIVGDDGGKLVSG